MKSLMLFCLMMFASLSSATELSSVAMGSFEKVKSHGWITGVPISIRIHTTNYELEPERCDGYISVRNTFFGDIMSHRVDIDMYCKSVNPVYRTPITVPQGDGEVWIFNANAEPIWIMDRCVMRTLDSIRLITYIDIFCQ